MRLYKSGSPIEVRHLTPGTLCIAYEKDPLGLSKEWEEYFIMVIVGANKSTMRVQVNSESWDPWIPCQPIKKTEKVVVLNAFKLSET